MTSSRWVILLLTCLLLAWQTYDFLRARSETRRLLAIYRQACTRGYRVIPARGGSHKCGWRIQLPNGDLAEPFFHTLNAVVDWLHCEMNT
jgi:hypothetical protein